MQQMSEWPYYKSEGEMLLAGFVLDGETKCIFPKCAAPILLWHRRCPGDTPDFESVLVDAATYRLHSDMCPVINRYADSEGRAAAERDLRRRVQRQVRDGKLASAGGSE
jgi:hypothetical protein